MKTSLSSRRFRQGAMATALTLLFVGIVVALNLLVARVDGAYDLSIDLTKEKVFTLSEDTTEYLQRLDTPVSIYVLNTEQAFEAEGSHVKQANGIIKRYAELSPYITLSYINLVQDPGFIELFPDHYLQMNQIMVVSGDEVRQVFADDLFNLQLYELEDGGYDVGVTSSKAEQTLTNAIVAVTSKEEQKVAIITGHDETEASGLRSLLEMNNYNVSYLKLNTQDIPPDVQMVVISAPRVDYEEEELKELDRFLYNNGNYGRTLFYLAAIDQPELPGLSTLLNQWGINVGQGTVFETDPFYQNYHSPFYTNTLYAEEEYAKVMRNSGLPVAMPNSRPLEVLEMPGVETTVLLSFSARAGIRSPEDLASGTWTVDGQPTVGPIPALVLSQKTDYNGAVQVTSSVLVCGASLAVDAETLVTPIFANSRYFLSTIGTLLQREDNVIIESKLMGIPMLYISYGQAMVWGFLFAVMLPLAVLAVGGVVFFQRRHL